MLKRFFLTLSVFLIVFFLFWPIFTRAQGPVIINFFYSKTCPHCVKEEIFLNELEQELGDKITINRYEISDSNNRDLFTQFINSSGKVINGVPATFIEKEVIVGFRTSADTGQQIRDIIEKCLKACEEDNPLLVNLPIFGKTDLSRYSLFGLTAVIAALDGFNPCAMWVLLILIGILLGMKNRRRMWILGSTFIGASALVYLIFLAAWLKFFQFIGIVRPVQIIIGIFAAGVGVYYLRRFWKSKPGECEVTNIKQRKKIIDRMRDVVHRHSLWLALIGIVGLAFLVNLIELACSAGLPAIYTQVLALSQLPAWQHYLYLILYIVIFMLDDMIVFALAMLTTKAVGTSGRYSRWATLIGAIIIFILGLLLIFKPGWVMFG